MTLEATFVQDGKAIDYTPGAVRLKAERRRRQSRQYLAWRQGDTHSGRL